jgi:hypothetical protein
MTQKRQEMWESSIWEFHGKFPILTHSLLEKASFIVAKKGIVSMAGAAS